jgi:hypothetical protein
MRCIFWTAGRTLLPLAEQEMAAVDEVHEPFDSRGYSLVERLGVGSYGEVRLYYHPAVGFRAVKFIKRCAFTEREVQYLRGLRHAAMT